MERPKDPFELVLGLRDDVAELRANMRHMSSDMGEMKQDIRRLDDRIFQVLLVQLATLTGTLGSLIVALIALTNH